MYWFTASFFTLAFILSSSTMDTIIQWNCRGLKSNFDELSLLINNHKPVAVCLQETFLKRGMISLSNIIPFTTKSLPTVRKPEVVFPLLSVTTFLIKLSLLTQICKLLPSDYLCTVLLLYVLYISPQAHLSMRPV